MLNELYTTFLSYEELNTVAGRISDTVGGHIADYPFLGELTGLLKTDIGNLGAALNRDRTSKFTVLIEQSDNQRDSSFIALRDYLKACSSRSVLELATAGEYLTAIVKKHGWTLYARTYTEETAALKALLTELDGTEATTAIQTLNAAPWYDDLKAAQAAFEETYNNKITAEAQADYPLLRETRSKIIRHLTALLDFIRVLGEVNTSDTYTAMVEQLNEIINDVMTVARARRTRETQEPVATESPQIS